MSNNRDQLPPEQQPGAQAQQQATQIQKQKDEALNKFAESKRLDYMAYYAATHTLRSYRCLEGPGKETEEEKRDKSKAGLASINSELKILKDGLYEEEVTKVKFRVSNGLAYPVPWKFSIPWEDNFRLQYGVIMDFLARKQGAKTIKIEFGSSILTNSSLGGPSDLDKVDVLIDMARKAGLKIKFGANLMKYFDKLPPEQRQKYYDLEDELQKNYTQKESVRENFEKTHTFDLLSSRLNTPEKLATQVGLPPGTVANQANAGEKLIEKILGKNDQALKDEARIKKIDEQLSALPERLEVATKALEEVSHQWRAHETLLGMEKMPINDVRKAFETGEKNRERIVPAMLNEMEDLKVREQIWRAELAKMKTELQNKLAAQPAPADADRVKFTKQIEEIDKVLDRQEIKDLQTHLNEHVTHIHELQNKETEFMEKSLPVFESVAQQISEKSDPADAGLEGLLRANNLNQVQDVLRDHFNVEAAALPGVTEKLGSALLERANIKYTQLAQEPNQRPSM